MTHSSDSQRPRCTRWQLTAAAVLLLASVGWASKVNAAEPGGGGSAASATVGAGGVTALAIDPHAPTRTILYAGTGCSGVLKSLDGGDSWSAVNTGLPDHANVSALAIDPATPATLYAGGVGGVFRSLNGGSSWSAVNTGLTYGGVSALAIDPAKPATLYAGGYGVFRSLNGGSSWQATELVGDATCGDGVAACGEECDDGNRVDGDGCTNDCTVCGDGTITAPEECDDGNLSSGDDCDAQCREPGVVGIGTPQSCTEAEFEAALAQRSVCFNCGPAPVTITLTSEKAITADTTMTVGVWSR